MARAQSNRDARRDLVLALAVTFPGVALLIAIGWAFDWWKPGGYLEKFQTLVTGLIAIVAAIVAAYFVQKQINLARDQEQERVDRVGSEVDRGDTPRDERHFLSGARASFDTYPAGES
jgi:hypothetical protein